MNFGFRTRQYAVKNAWAGMVRPKEVKIRRLISRNRGFSAISFSVCMQGTIKAMSIIDAGYGTSPLVALAHPRMTPKTRAVVSVGRILFCPQHWLLCHFGLY
jgi:hypothetical protein